MKSVFSCIYLETRVECPFKNVLIAKLTSDKSTFFCCSLNSLIKKIFSVKWISLGTDSVLTQCLYRVRSDRLLVMSAFFLIHRLKVESSLSHLVLFNRSCIDSSALKSCSSDWTNGVRQKEEREEEVGCFSFASWKRAFIFKTNFSTLSNSNFSLFSFFT